MLGRSFSCADIPIKIVIKDVELPTLELVDLPGLCANPPALRQQSHALVQQYLSKEDTMVLCVVPATEPSITSSEAIHMIEEAGKLKQTILALSMVRTATLQACCDDVVSRLVLRLAAKSVGFTFSVQGLSMVLFPTAPYTHYLFAGFGHPLQLLLHGHAWLCS